MTAMTAMAAMHGRMGARWAWRLARHFARQLAIAAVASSTVVASPPPAAPVAPLPLRLADTGLYAPGSTAQLAAGVVGYSPQYPLWSDGAAKHRWLALPPGAAIDASQADAWQFPPGTRLWKEFALDGRPVETRYIERLADGSWRFATYLWNAAGSEARLAPAGGVPAWPVAAAPGGRYAVPSRDDCLACHGSAPVPVLGVSALQLSPDRDPLAAGRHAVRPDDLDLRGFAARGLLRGLPEALIASPPRIAGRTPLERAALGALHGNCAHCHNRSDNRVPLRLTLAQRAGDALASRDEVIAATVGARARYQPVEGAAAHVVVAGDPSQSVLLQRMRTRLAQRQMPPLGTALPDAEGQSLIERWIASDLFVTPKEKLP